LRQKLDPRHPGHPLIYEKQCHDISSQFKLSHNLDCTLPRVRSDDSVLLTIFSPKILLQCVQEVRVVINSEDDRLCHI
jgi:hypothetical protein